MITKLIRGTALVFAGMYLILILNMPFCVAVSWVQKRFYDFGYVPDQCTKKPIEVILHFNLGSEP